VPGHIYCLFACEQLDCTLRDLRYKMKARKVKPKKVLAKGWDGRPHWRSYIPRSLDPALAAPDANPPATPTDGAATAAPAPAFTERQYQILDRLYAFRAFDEASRETLDDIAGVLNADSAVLRRCVREELKPKGFVATRRGREGGCWLTAAGRRIFETPA